MFRATLIAFVLVSPVWAATPKSAAEVAWAWNVAGATDEATVMAAWAWSASECQPGCQCGPDCGCGHDDCKCTQSDCYKKLRERAESQHKPLVVSVGCPVHPIAGALACRWDAFPGAAAPAIIVGRADGQGVFVHAATLPAKATNEQITAAFGKACPTCPTCPNGQCSAGVK